MKKILMIAVVALLCLGTAFAWQDNYTQRSEEVQTFYTLRRISGTSTANPTFPITADQLLGLVEKLDTTGFGPQAKELYDNLVDKLSSPQVLSSMDDIGFDFDAKVVAFGVHNTDTVDELYYPYWNRPSAVDLEFTFNLTPAFTTYIDLDLRPTYGYSRYSSPNIEGFVTMIKSCVFVPNDDQHYTGLSVQLPMKAYGSFGNSNFNLTIGRDRVSEGNGITGNLTLGDNFIFSDYIKASFAKGTFSYDMTLIGYDSAIDQNFRFKNDRKNVVNHHFSVSFFKNLNISITEGAMIYTNDIFSDVRLLNPFMMIHDMFTFIGGDTNNYFSAEATANLPSGFQLDVQYMFDQIHAGFESEDSGETASALLVGLTWANEIGPGILTAYTEFARVSPGCYLKENEPGWNTEEWTGRYEDLDLIMEVSEIWAYCFNQSALGYTYGPDSLVMAGGASYLWKGIDFTFDVLFMSKGPYGFGENEQRASDLPADPDAVDTSVIRLNLGASGSAHNGKVSFDIGAGLNITQNRNHDASNGIEIAPLFKLSLQFDPMAFFKRHGL